MLRGRLAPLSEVSLRVSRRCRAGVWREFPRAVGFACRRERGPLDGSTRNGPNTSAENDNASLSSGGVVRGLATDIGTRYASLSLRAAHAVTFPKQSARSRTQGGPLLSSRGPILGSLSALR